MGAAPHATRDAAIESDRDLTKRGEHMRIAWITDTFDEGFGGGVVSARRFVAALRERHEVTVVTTGKPGAGKLTVPGIQLPIEAMRGNGFTFGWPTPAVFEAACRGVDVVHIGFGFALGISALRWARRNAVPCVTAFHVQPENVLYNVGLRSGLLSRQMYRAWVRHFYEPSDAVICPSAFAEERLRTHGLSKPTFVVSNGIPHHLVARVREAPRDTIMVLGVGRFSPEKRPDVILEAVARSRHRDRIGLVLVGTGPLESSLRARARALGVRVEIGPVSDAELTTLYGEADVFVHAGEVELEGMAVLEAIGSGLPLLVAASPESAASRFAPGPAFLFRRGDPDDLARRLDALLDDPAALRACSERACVNARAHDFASSVAALERAFDATIEAHARTASAIPMRSRRRPPRQGSVYSNS